MDNDEENRDPTKKSLILKKLEVHLYSVWFECLCLLFIVIECFLAIIELLIDLSVLQAGGGVSANQSQGPIPMSNQNSLIQSLTADSVRNAQITDGLHVLYIVILVLFVAEITTKIVIRQRDFINHRYEVFDACVVYMTLIITVVLHFIQLRVVRDATALLIGLRLWKLSNIIFGASVKERKQLEQHIYAYRKARLYAEERVNQLVQELSNKQVENEKLKELINATGKSCNSSHELIRKRIEKWKRSNSAEGGVSEFHEEHITPQSLRKCHATLTGQHSPSVIHSQNNSRCASRQDSMNDQISDNVQSNNGNLELSRDPNGAVVQAEVEVHNMKAGAGYHNPSFVNDREVVLSAVNLDNYICSGDIKGNGMVRSASQSSFEPSFYEAFSPEEMEVIRRIATVQKHCGEGVPMTSL